MPKAKKVRTVNQQLNDNKLKHQAMKNKLSATTKTTKLGAAMMAHIDKKAKKVAGNIKKRKSNGGSGG